MIADCRKCEYFIPLDKFEENDMLDLLDEAESMRFHGVDVKGWCCKYHRFVRYYTGKCRGYKPKHKPIKIINLEGKEVVLYR